MSTTQVDLITEKTAYKVLDNHQFIILWQTLYNECPHATAFQAPNFVRIWYETYRYQWQPVVIQAQNSDGSLVGLWMLAHNPKTGVITNVGAHQAEYHTWLALPGKDISFLSSAWAILTQQFTFEALRFKYLPATSLGGMLQIALGAKSGGVVLRKHNRPILKIDPDDIKASFAKKSNKSRFNRLKKIGKLEFHQVTDSVELEQVLDELIVYYDFRQGAANNSFPFQEDPMKRKFHSDLFSSAPNNVYVTVTYLSEQPIAAFWGTVSGQTVHLGMLIFSPLFARYSPGKLHIMQLSEHLLKDGKNILDLTPGGDPWKERFTNAHDEVAEAIVYRSKWIRIQANMLDRALQWGKWCGSKVGITPADARQILATLGKIKPHTVIQKIRNWINRDFEYRIYQSGQTLAEMCHFDKRVRCNSLSDLLSFDPGESWQTRHEFLRNALERLERGESVYTISIDGRLAHCGWAVKNQAKFDMAEVKQSMLLPSGSTIFYGFYSHPDFRDQGLHRATIEHMLDEAVTDEETKNVYISVPADNLFSRHVIETMDFEYLGSFFLGRSFGAERKWASPLLINSETTYA